MEDGNNGFILHVGKRVVHKENPPELDESQKFAKKVAWQKKIEEIHCVVAPMVDQRLLSFLSIFSANT